MPASDNPVLESAIAAQTSHDEKPFHVQFARLPWRHRLASKLLLLTILAVLITEILIFVPFLANSRVRWLEARLDTASAVSEAVTVDGDADLPANVQNIVLVESGTKSVTVHKNDQSRELVIQSPDGNLTIDQVIDLDHMSEAAAIWDAFDTLINGGNRIIRVYGARSLEGAKDRVVDIVMSDGPLHKALVRYARNVLAISLAISLIAASLIYLIINEVLLRPVRYMHRNMIAFATSPDNPAMVLVPEVRKDEFSIAQRQIAKLQSELQQTLKEQKHLADLGLAVSKINHDMRNILASAQLMSDRLTDTKDPMVQRFAPKLVKTLSRAINYTESVLEYGRSVEAAPNIRAISLHSVVIDVQALLNLGSESPIDFHNEVHEELMVNADSEQLFRVLSNLTRNAIQAMQADKAEGKNKRLTISAKRTAASVTILVSDTGPGLPKKARDNLFQAFKGSARSDGTGLGLAIANELIEAHGGSIELISSDETGTQFHITLPN